MAVLIELISPAACGAVFNTQGIANIELPITFSGSTTPPTLNPAFSPAPGTIIRTQAITMPIQANSPAVVGSLTIWAVFASGLAETIWANGAFTSAYSAGSSFSGTVGTSRTVSATIVRAATWDQSSMTIYASVTDSFGVNATLSGSFAVSNPTFGTPDTLAPSVSNYIAPVLTSDTATFDATDDRGIRQITIWVRYVDGSQEQVFDGSRFQTLFSSSTQTPISGASVGFHFVLARTGGWASVPVTLLTSIVDTSSNVG